MPSHRTGDRKYQRKDHQNPNVKATLQIGSRQFLISVVDHDDDPDRPMVTIGTIPGLNSMDLTVLTEPELDALLRVWTDAIERARPIVQSLDAEAAAAAAAGDTSFKRLWRIPAVRRDFK